MSRRKKNIRIMLNRPRNPIIECEVNQIRRKVIVSVSVGLS